MDRYIFVLLQHGIFRAGKKTKKISNIISKIPKGQIPSGGKQVLDNEALDLPEDLPATTNTKAVQIKYTMTVRHDTFTSRQRSCRKVMFSQTSVYSKEEGVDTSHAS